MTMWHIDQRKEKLTVTTCSFVIRQSHKGENATYQGTLYTTATLCSCQNQKTAVSETQDSLATLLIGTV